MIGAGRDGIQKEPFLQLPHRGVRHIREADTGAAGSVGPNHLAGGVQERFCFRQVQAEIQAAVDFRRRGRLDRHSLFADVQNLIEVEHHAAGVGIQTGVGRGVNFLPDMTTAFAERGRPSRFGFSRLGRGGVHTEATSYRSTSQKKIPVSKSFGR
jgi:hypothetical protein